MVLWFGVCFYKYTNKFRDLQILLTQIHHIPGVWVKENWTNKRVIGNKINYPIAYNTKLT